ncbi:hypothetical protein [Streptomyces youssoufiensis]
MTRGRSWTSRREEATALATEAEGFLMAHAHHAEARREAQALCAELPWLTSAQTDDLVRHYVSRRLALTRQMLGVTVRRIEELRGEYEARYAQLRHRLLTCHIALATGVLAAAVAVGAAVATWAR